MHVKALGTMQRSITASILGRATAGGAIGCMPKPWPRCNAASQLPSLGGPPRSGYAADQRLQTAAKKKQIMRE